MDSALKNAIETMLEQYEIKNDQDQINALKEIYQEIILMGLSRAGFFESAAFYGGTALRIFYHLDRFSEDLDFSLLTPDPNFDLDYYIGYLQKLFDEYGIDVIVEQKYKSQRSPVRSAFLKTNTKEQILTFFPQNKNYQKLHPDQKIRIKFEIDTEPPASAITEWKTSLLPLPYRVRMYDRSSLFAGKIHAILCRGWKDRVKGRDLYDYVFYLSRNIPVNLENLNAKLIGSGFTQQPLSIEQVKDALREKFHKIDYSEAKNDVFPFVQKISLPSLQLWSADFFSEITENLQTNT